MSRPVALSLTERHSDLTERTILESAVHLLERSSLTELTARAVAKQAAISERTVFRYFPSRDEFLDAVAGEVRRALNAPPPPQSLDELYAAPRALYGAFEARPNLTKAALHTELFDRMRETQAKDRWTAIRKLVDAYAPRRTERECRIAGANIRYYLSATTWHYYRFYFGFNLADAITCAEVSIRQSVEALAVRR